MTPKAKPTTLDPLDPRVVHVFHVRGPQFGRHNTLYWRMITCDGRYRSLGSSKHEALDKITVLMGAERSLLGLITYRHICDSAEARAEITDLRRRWKASHAAATD